MKSRMKKEIKSYFFQKLVKKILKNINLKNIRALNLLFLIFAVSPGAFANLTISISQGQDKPYPIALIPFSSPDIPSKDLPNGFSEVILDDLGNSGRFSLLNQSAMPEHPTQVSALHLNQWKKAVPQTEYAVMGSVKSDGENFDLTYSVVSLLNGDVLYGQHFDHIHTPEMRGLAHFIADKIYQTITGDRGYFSTRLAYVSVIGDMSDSPIYRLVICDADGFNPRVLLQQQDNPIASPIWSPDGKFLAYVSYVHNRMAVYTIELATGERKVIANFNGINSAPAFSPDGKSLAMALSLGESSSTNLYLYDLTSQHLKKLTHNGTNTSPAFSPDGQSIIFNSDRAGSPQLYILHLSDLSIHLVSHEGIQNFSPMFLPNTENNSQDIVFMHQESSGGPINIAVMNLESNAMRVLTHGGLDKSPTPSPNGKMILYSNFDQERGVLAEVSIDGKLHANLPATAGSVQSPAWSPFLN